jgi:hypothetical protein
MHFSTFPQVPAWLAGLASIIALHLPSPCYHKAIAALALKLLPVVYPSVTLSERSPTLNALQLIPVAVSLGEDALKLTQALEASNKDEAVAAVVAAAPVLAELFNQPELPALLTAERVSAAFDFVIAGEKIVAALGFHLPNQAPTDAPVEQSAA